MNSIITSFKIMSKCKLIQYKAVGFFRILLSIFIVILCDLGHTYSSGTVTQSEIQLNKPVTVTQTSFLKLGQECYASEQCNHTDSHVICTFSGTMDITPMICRCRFGYIAEEIEGRKMCIPSNRNSLLSGIPHLDSRDTVPVVMGCLAAGLAIFACCAGIFQLMSRKRYDHSQNTSGYLEELEHFPPHEQQPFISGVHLQAGMPRNAMNFPPNFPQDLPPSYEEAIKHLPPVYLNNYSSAGVVT